MSFYGNTFYELTNAFSTILIKKMYDDITAEELRAVGLEGKFTLAPGNQWISMNVNKDSNTCEILHKESQSGDFSGIQVVEDIDNSIALKAGDTIKVDSFIYDGAGHITGKGTSQYFTLPINETEINLEQLNSDMVDVKALNETQNGRLNSLEGTVSSQTTSLEDLDTRVGVVEEFGPRIDSLEQTSAIIGELNDLTANENLTITSAIGNIDNIIGEEFKFNTIVDYVANLSDEVTATDNQVKLNLTGIKVAFQKLCNILNENGIEIDYNSLWEV